MAITLKFKVADQDVWSVYRYGWDGPLKKYINNPDFKVKETEKGEIKEALKKQEILLAKMHKK